MVKVDRWSDRMALVKLTDLQTGTLIKKSTRQTGTLALDRMEHWSVVRLAGLLICE